MKEISALYAEWAIQHVKKCKKFWRSTIGNFNRDLVNEAMIKKLQELADKDENYLLALKVECPRFFNKDGNPVWREKKSPS